MIDWCSAGGGGGGGVQRLVTRRRDRTRVQARVAVTRLLGSWLSQSINCENMVLCLLFFILFFLWSADSLFFIIFVRSASHVFLFKLFFLLGLHHMYFPKLFS